jgi:hypothetical protein
VFAPIQADPAAGQVRRVTFVPFLPDGRCVLIERPEGPALPAGEVLDGEDYLVDTVLRVPLQTAGFRYQHLRPFGIDGGHLYAWIEGAPYHGDRPHEEPELTFCPAEEAATTVQPGTGRLLVSNYGAAPAIGSPTAVQTLQSLSFPCHGQTSGGIQSGRPPAPTAWINAPIRPPGE